jgi:release factor glutamine methyltransferase
MDVEDALDGVKCDVVIANPPYIPNDQELPKDVAEHEPAAALFGGPDGMELPRRFINAAARILKSGGFLAIEHHESQPLDIAAAMASSFDDIQLHNDLVGRPRFTTGIRR